MALNSLLVLMCRSETTHSLMMHNGTSSSYRSVSWIGLWSFLVKLSVLWAPLYLQPGWCYNLKKICYILYFTFNKPILVELKFCTQQQILNWVNVTWSKIWWFFADLTIFKMAAVRHLGIVLPPYETTHKVSVAVRSCLSNFMSIWYTDLKM